MTHASMFFERNDCTLLITWETPNIRGAGFFYQEGTWLPRAFHSRVSDTYGPHQVRRGLIGEESGEVGSVCGCEGRGERQARRQQRLPQAAWAVSILRRHEHAGLSVSGRATQRAQAAAARSMLNVKDIEKAMPAAVTGSK